uniref:Uncharacterized protein n=1 Tax=Panagrolaimus davidi TaxID=227884 RepID=A0A914QN85_9BILA
MDNTGFINCYLQKKISRSEALELLSKQNMPQNDDERIIFTQDPMQPVTSVAPPPSRSTVPKITILPQVPQLHRISATTKASSFLNTTKNDELNNPKTEYIKLKIDHDKLKTEHEKLRQEFDTFKEETEHRIQQLFLAVTRQGSVEDLMVSSLPIFFETNRIRKSFPLQITFYDQPSRKVDLVEIMINSPKCKDGITTGKEIADLFKDILWKIFGRDNIHHYTAATSRVKKGLTPIAPEVIEAIRTLFYEGFRIDKNNKDSNYLEAGHKRNEIDRVIKSTSSYLFNNSRRSKNQTSPRNSVQEYYDDSNSQYYGAQQHSISDSDSEDTYPKRMKISENLDDCFKYEPDAEF